MSDLVHDLIFTAAHRVPGAEALVYGAERLDYAALERAVRGAAAQLLRAGLKPRERVAVYLEKRVENVAAMFGASAAGAVFVPVNPLLKAAQVAHILADCDARVLVTSSERLHGLAEVLAQCPGLRTIIVVGAAALPQAPGALQVLAWERGAAPAPGAAHPAIDADMAAILYTSGSTGKPKGVVLSHRNIVAGARSVAGYLGNTGGDRILAVLPLSFDYGLSQLTTAFHSGAAVVLINHLFARDLLKAVFAERITGLAAVPPLWIQLAQLDWPAGCSLRYLTNSGGAMPRATVAALRARLPEAELFLMYGLTEAFRSTYLPPSELARRPDSMGRAIPNAEVLVVRPDGSLCEANEPGELVHRGALVSLGYWNDPAKTAQRFRPAPGQDPALPLAELAVWSGDTVRRDEEGYLYFIGRSDDMIKVSGYRVSPAEVEEALHESGLVEEAVAFGVPHPVMGQAIVLLAVAREAGLTPALLQKECQRRLPVWMVPAHIALLPGPLPRNPNGKFDRPALRAPLVALFESE
ncbi:acyl-CoA ligase (AMP-forming), exosortase A system-associated [Telluria aromaticivorans]|uniref:Acyl-CoA ligase (AMP-forming), exosortase A system-associated n=1 Tax=Telluria aromaticivorans TaxID=2725995 RepID=A0A7Y2K0B6_9BURK|nr:acyl-CoA ligase (AMP-forming), exosortase A system-associated [Telluria aromaticivorans]NNG24216.1 acyl-CoA ligase (AMP-forming), exosortase A system-associated [Telluria aromaticivorans]